MKYFLILLALLSCGVMYAQSADTLPGFSKKLWGEELTYFSPRRQFANRSLLSRCMPFEPVSWEAPVYKGNQPMVTYRLLIGHSTGMSSGERQFQLVLNQQTALTITTQKKMTSSYTLTGEKNGVSYRFVQEVYDANKDAFGILYITVPKKMVREKALFTLTGVDVGSRDWMMVFMYDFQPKTEVKSMNLISRKERKRKLSVFCDNPSNQEVRMQVSSKHFSVEKVLKPGYNSLEVLAYDETFTGTDSVKIVVGENTSWQTVTVNPIAITRSTLCIIPTTTSVIRTYKLTWNRSKMPTFEPL